MYLAAERKVCPQYRFSTSDKSPSYSRTVRTKGFPDFCVLGGLRATRTLPAKDGVVSEWPTTHPSESVVAVSRTRPDALLNPSEFYSINRGHLDKFRTICLDCSLRLWLEDESPDAAQSNCSRSATAQGIPLLTRSGRFNLVDRNTD
jgi:hypothetical protein